MARTSTSGQSYPLLSRVADPAIREVLRMLMDQINELRQPASSMDLGGNTITGVAAPTADSHVANKSYVDSTFSSVRSSLLGSGATPLDVTALRGQLSQVQRAKLRVNPAGNPLPTTGQAFELLYDVDTAAQYYWDANTSTWTAL